MTMGRCGLLAFSRRQSLRFSSCSGSAAISAVRAASSRKIFLSCLLIITFFVCSLIGRQMQPNFGLAALELLKENTNRERTSSPETVLLSSFLLLLEADFEFADDVGLGKYDAAGFL